MLIKKCLFVDFKTEYLSVVTNKMIPKIVKKKKKKNFLLKIINSLINKINKNGLKKLDKKKTSV